MPRGTGVPPVCHVPVASAITGRQSNRVSESLQNRIQRFADALLISLREASGYRRHGRDARATQVHAHPGAQRATPLPTKSKNFCRACRANRSRAAPACARARSAGVYIDEHTLPARRRPEPPEAKDPVTCTIEFERTNPISASNPARPTGVSRVRFVGPAPNRREPAPRCAMILRQRAPNNRPSHVTSDAQIRQAIHRDFLRQNARP
jgi:hypothetical protein